MSRTEIPIHKVRAETAHAAALASVQAVPIDHKAVRFPTFPAIEKTSVMKFEADSVQSVEDKTNTYALLMRAPHSPIWFSKSISGAVTGSQYVYRDLTGNQPGLPADHGEVYELDTLFTSDAGLKTTFNTQAFCGSYYPALDDSGRVWFYCPAGFSVSTSFKAFDNLSGGQWRLTFEYVTEFNTADIQIFNATGGCVNQYISCTFNQLSGCWFRPTTLQCVNAASPNQTSMTQILVGYCTGGTLQGPTPTDAQFKTTYFDPPAIAAGSPAATLTHPWRDTRANAVSALCRNVTAVLNKEGTVTSYRTPVTGSGVLAPGYIVKFDSLVSMTQAEDRYFGPLEKGWYAFAPPCQASTKFRDWTFGESDAPCWRLDAFNHIIVVRFSDYGSGGVNATNLGVTACYHIEWRNTSVFWETGICRTPVEEWHSSMVALAAMPCMYENWVHLGLIAQAARAAAAWAIPKAISVARPYVTKAFNKHVAPFAGKAVSTAAQYIAEKAANAVTRKVRKQQPRARPKPRAQRKK